MDEKLKPIDFAEISAKLDELNLVLKEILVDTLAKNVEIEQLRELFRSVETLESEMKKTRNVMKSKIDRTSVQIRKLREGIEKQIVQNVVQN